MEVAFADIEAEFMRRVHSVVWCSLATTDRQGRPRSRILHPIWEVTTGRPVGWIATRRHTLKAAHFAHNPYVSLAYIADVSNPVYVDCRVEWDADLDHKQRIWKMFKEAAPPLGYDPAPIFESPDHPNFGLLKLLPWRVEVTTVPADKRVWHAPPAE